MAAYRELTTDAGIFAQPDAATSIAAAKRLRSEGVLAGDETVVAILTGHGTKDLTPLAGAAGLRMETCSLDELPSMLE